MGASPENDLDAEQTEGSWKRQCGLKTEDPTLLPKCLVGCRVGTRSEELPSEGRPQG